MQEQLWKIVVPSGPIPQLHAGVAEARDVCSMAQGEQYLIDRLQRGFIATFWVQVILVVIVPGVNEPDKLLQYLRIFLAEVDMAGGGFLHHQVSP
jgi:hypothetical protein